MKVTEFLLRKANDRKRRDSLLLRNEAFADIPRAVDQAEIIEELEMVVKLDSEI